MVKLIPIATLLVTGASAAHAAAQAPQIVHYQPTLDITQDIGCGTRAPTKAAKLEHNRRLAELYYLNFQQDRQRGRNYNWAVHHCMADTSSVLLGAVEPLADPHVRQANATQATGSSTGSVAGRDPSVLSGEQRGYFATFPDWGTIPNTLVVVPFEEGAFFRMMYGGHDKDGKYYSIWETNLILVNDEGRITHFEMWNDTIGMDATTRKAFGKGIDSLGLGGYMKATEAFPKGEGAH
jgi:hypothetical protein